MVALILSAVTVATMSVPRTARPCWCRPRCAACRARQVGPQLGRCSRIGVEQAQGVDAQQVVKRERLEFALRSAADQRHGAGTGRAGVCGITADMAAVRSAVVRVSSLNSSGAPVATSASTPNAITVGKPQRVLGGGR